MADGSPRRFNYGGGEHEHGAGAVALNALPPASPADARGGVAGEGGTGGGGDHREAVSVNAMAWYVPACTHPPGVRPDQVPGPRAAHSANLIGNKLYLFGGCEAVAARAQARARARARARLRRCRAAGASGADAGAGAARALSFVRFRGGGGGGGGRSVRLTAHTAQLHAPPRATPRPLSPLSCRERQAGPERPARA